MDEQPDPVTRLGPDSGGRDPGAPARHPVYTWEWGPDQARRPGLPWIGIFLLVFGGAAAASSSCSRGPRRSGPSWCWRSASPSSSSGRSTAAPDPCYAGAIITALAAPGVINAAGFDVDGLGTFCFGVAFLFIAGVRVASGGGWGWQAIFGGLLVLLGGVNMLTPEVGGLLVPLVLLGLGCPPDLRRRASRSNPASEGSYGRTAVDRGLVIARTSAIRSSSSSVTTNGGPSRIVSPSVPSALPVPE